jgi:hypothetical protein
VIARAEIRPDAATLPPWMRLGIGTTSTGRAPRKRSAGTNPCPRHRWIASGRHSQTGHHEAARQKVARLLAEIQADGPGP